MRIPTCLLLLPVLVVARNPDKRQLTPDRTGEPAEPPPAPPPSMVMVKGGIMAAGPSMVSTGKGSTGVTKGPIGMNYRGTSMGGGSTGGGRGGGGGGDPSHEGRSLGRKAKMVAMKPSVIPLGNTAPTKPGEEALNAPQLAFLALLDHTFNTSVFYYRRQCG
ncbi:hypothetical protein EG327_000114 [Venturia inaequalis]|uniref:Uncharacterized protein n=1 Tax=Venturia inaequalis TaxID=5025 RepID=A0A8H3ZCQ4_VENIN|nr:hypothetical protein EG327_000114 [Venturia inaequalis]